MMSRALVAPARLAGASLMRTQSDERLVDLVRAGNEGAFEAIVARHNRDLQRYCSRFLPASRAEDAVQQAFLRAHDTLRSSTGAMVLRPWLYRIAHNTALNLLRERASNFEALPEDLDGVDRPDQVAERNETLRDALAAVGSLPRRQRDAIILRELEGRSYEEIATTLGVSGGAVRQLLSRARGTLQAGATAITPFGLAGRWPVGTRHADSVGARIAEACAAGGGGAVLVKATATIAVSGALVGGVGGVTVGDHERARPNTALAALAAPNHGPDADAVAALAARHGQSRSRARDDRGRRGRSGGDDAHRGSRRGGRGDRGEARHTESHEQGSGGSTGSGHDDAAGHGGEAPAKHQDSHSGQGGGKAGETPEAETVEPERQSTAVSPGAQAETETPASGRSGSSGSGSSGSSGGSGSPGSGSSGSGHGADPKPADDDS